MSPEPYKIYEGRVVPTILSRATYKDVPLKCALPYDFMDPVVGDQFRVNPRLRERALEYGLESSLELSARSYVVIGRMAIRRYDLEDGLRSYKNALANSLKLARLVGSYQREHSPLLSEGEISALSIVSIQEALEPGLRELIVSRDVLFNEEMYIRFVEELRKEETRRRWAA